MGRIHRYCQKKDCLIFNFFAQNTVEGRVLQKLLDKLQEIRDALNDDAVFDVVGEVLPANQVERLLRDFYAGRRGEEDVHAQLEMVVSRDDFERICHSALEGLARRSLNLPMLLEQRALAQERRIVPETIARFFKNATEQLGVELQEVRDQAQTFRVGRLPSSLYDVARGHDWRLPTLAKSYDRITFERSVSDDDPRFEWVTPGHPLFEAVRRQAEHEARPHFRQGVIFYEVEGEEPAMLEIYTAAVADGTGKTSYERMFVVETSASGARYLREPTYLLGLLPPDNKPQPILQINLDEAALQAFLYERALQPFLQQSAAERQKDLDLVKRYVELCFAELIDKRDEVLTKHLIARDHGDPTAEGLIEIESQKILDLQRRRDNRCEELERQRALYLRGLERIAVALVLPHPERRAPEVLHLVANPETERRAMEAVIAYEAARGCTVKDVHEQNLGYDLWSLHEGTGELRLIEVKGIGAATGTVCLTPNEKRMAEDRPDVFWLYVVTDCNTNPTVQGPIPDPARFPWREIIMVIIYLTHHAFCETIRSWKTRAHTAARRKSAQITSRRLYRKPFYTSKNLTRLTPSWLNCAGLMA